MPKLTLKAVLSPEAQAKIDALKGNGDRDKAKPPPPHSLKPFAIKTKAAVSKTPASAPKLEDKLEDKQRHQAYLTKIKTVQQWLNQMWPSLFDLSADRKSVV